MEVHHSSRKKKNIQEYLLESLMIFVAVVMGFLAESLRETMIKHEKEKHYIESLAQDLKTDTTEVQWALNGQEVSMQKIDKALAIPAERLSNLGAQDSFFHHFFFFYSFVFEFVQHDNTYTQLKNAGGFSVFRKQGVIDSIDKLYSFYKQAVYSNRVYYIDYYNKIVELATRFMDLPSPPTDFNDELVTVVPAQVKVITQFDWPLIKQFYSLLRYVKGCLKYYMDMERVYKTEAERLLNYLNRKYKLE